MFLLTLGKVALCCFLEALLLLVKVDADVEVHETDEGLLNDLAVMVTSGFETNSF